MIFWIRARAERRISRVPNFGFELLQLLLDFIAAERGQPLQVHNEDRSLACSAESFVVPFADTL